MIKLGQDYVCAKDFTCLNRPFKKGSIFPVRRYRKLARGILRQGKIKPKTPIALPAGVILLDVLGEGPFTVKHRGGGRWVILNAAEEIVSETASKGDVGSKVAEMNQAQAGG